jgi:hypothetical protein
MSSPTEQQQQYSPDLKANPPIVPNPTLPQDEIIQPTLVNDNYGPCPNGGDHIVRSEYSNGAIAFAAIILPIPQLFSKKLVCKKCKQQFGNEPKPGF